MRIAAGAPVTAFTLPWQVAPPRESRTIVVKATFDLVGDFHRDIRGAKIRFVGEGKKDDPAAAKYMEGIAEHQTGKAGDITAGLPPQDYTSYPYIEIYGDANGRIVLELDLEQVEIIGTPIPACESDPVSREKQQQNMVAFLGGMAQELGSTPGPMTGVGAATVSRPLTRRTRELWLVAVADRGVVVHVHAYADAKTATQALASYLAEFNEYKGPAGIRAIRRWLREHDENLSVEITSQPWQERSPPS